MPARQTLMRPVTDNSLAVRWGWLLVASWWLCCDARADEAREFDLHVADMRLPAARLVDIDSANRLVFQVSGQQQAVMPSEIVRWGAARPGSGAPLVWLNDGSWLAGQIHWKSSTVMELVSDWFVPLELPVDSIRGIIFQPPPSLRHRAELAEEMRVAQGGEDIVWTATEQLSGVLSLNLQQSDAAEGKPVPEWKLVKSGRPSLLMGSDELRAILFSPVLRPALPKERRALGLSLRDGSSLNALSLVVHPDHVSVVLADKRQLKSLDRSSQFTEAIVGLTGNPTGSQWLGELEPARYRMVGEKLPLNWPLGRDRDLFQRALWKNGQPVEHGICMHAPSQAAYRWDGSPGRFIAELSHYAGSRDAAVGSIEGKVLLARGGALEEVVASRVLRPTSQSEYLSIDLKDAQLVVLLVGEADQGPIGDHALWRDARLARPAKPR